MYTAVMLIMLAGMPPTQLNDTRGPYWTQVECEHRLEEMKNAAISHFSAFGLEKIGTRCDKNETI